MVVSGPRVTNSREVETLRAHNLLSSLSQFLTLLFQSQVCLSMSKASPVGQRTPAKRVPILPPALSHLFLHSKKQRCALPSAIYFASDGAAPTSYFRCLFYFIPDNISAVSLSGEAEVLIRWPVVAKFVDALRSITIIVVILSFKPCTFWKTKKTNYYAFLFTIENIRSNLYVLINACFVIITLVPFV